MSITREPIYAALFAYFSGLNDGVTFKTATRKLVTWENIASEDQPAILMLQRRELCQKLPGTPPKWHLSVDLYLYVHTNAVLDPSQENAPSQLINPLLDAIETSLAIDDKQGNRCTLGGLVYHCYIDGTIEIFEGNQGDEAVCIIPITALVP